MPHDGLANNNTRIALSGDPVFNILFYTVASVCTYDYRNVLKILARFINTESFLFLQRIFLCATTKLVAHSTKLTKVHSCLLALKDKTSPPRGVFASPPNPWELAENASILLRA